MRVLLLRLILLILIFSSHAGAQQNDIYTSYSTDDGLPQSTIWNITQDKNGFLWMGTADGVCRFDGYNFTVYRNNPEDSTSIVGGLYFRIYVDSSGELWVISQNGISFYNSIRDNFQQIFTSKDLPVSANYNCIFGEDAQNIWAGMPSSGLIKIDKHTRKFTLVKNADYSAHSSQITWQTGFVSKGKIWMSGSSSYCYVYDINTSKFDTVYSAPNYRIADLNDTEVLAAAPGSVVLFNKRTLKYKVVPLELSKTQRAGITDILVESPSSIILSSSIGVFYIDSRTWKIKRQIVSFEEGRKRSYSFIQCVYKDWSGNLWIGTNGNGLKKLTRPYKNFKLYNNYSDDGNLVKAIYADKQKLYVGYYANGFDVFDRYNGWEKKVNFKKGPPVANNVYAILALDSGNLVVHHVLNNELSVYSVGSNSYRQFAPSINTLFSDNIAALNNYPFLLKTGNTVYVNYNDYLVSFDISSMSNVKPVIVHRFTGEMLACAYEDNKKNLWIGTINNVYCIEQGIVKRVDIAESILVKTINQDGAGNIWLGTIRGIYVLDSNKKIIHHYTENNGLRNRFIYGILRDDDGNMWFSHNKGLSVYKAATRSFRHYGKEDGLQSNEFNTGAYFKAADGELFFGGINGVNSFNPREVKDNTNIPTVKITSIKLFDLPLKMDSAYWNVHRLTLPYTENSLSFEFTALEYTNPAKNQYAYMMEGVDDKWISSGDRRFARYPALLPGHYVFKVKAANNDGVWQNTPTSIVIDIVPPFWQRWWVRVLVVFLFIACLSGIIIWIQRQRHKREIRALELMQKIQLERERISRDLHDTVGTQLSLISNNIEWVAHPLKMITESEKEEKLHFVNETARDIIATLRETIWALNKQQIPIEEFSDKLKAFVQKQLSIYPEISLNFDEQIAVNLILGPSEALDLFRVCQEAIANALKYARANTLSIEVKSSNAAYKVSIADNGKGFDLTKVDPAIQNGVENMRYRANDIGGELEIFSEPGKGTRIVVTKKQ